MRCCALRAAKQLCMPKDRTFLIAANFTKEVSRNEKTFSSPMWFVYTGAAGIWGCSSLRQKKPRGSSRGVILTDLFGA